MTTRAGVQPHLLLTLKAPIPPDPAYPQHLKTIGDHIRWRRLELGLWLRDVAERIGVSVTTVNNWELGHAKAETRFVPGIVSFLGYDPRPCPLSVGGRVRWLRESFGLSLKGLGSILGVDEQSVGKCEREEEIGSELVSLFKAFREHCEGGHSLSTLKLPERKRRVPDARPERLETLGDHFRKARLDRGISISDVAKTLGCSKWSVMNWELRRRGVSIRNTPAVLEFLGYDPFPKPKNLADVLLSIRRGRGITQAELAQRIGVAESTIRRWESGMEATGRGGPKLRRFLEEF